MPDVVRYVLYEFLTTFLGAVAAPLLISDSDFGSEQIVPAAPVPALHLCITYAFLPEMRSRDIFWSAPAPAPVPGKYSGSGSDSGSDSGSE